MTAAMDSCFLAGADLILEGRRVAGCGVLVAAGRIAAILPAAARPGADRVTLPPDAVLAPGFIDVQVNGGGGVLFNDAPTAEAALAIAAAHRRLGTTGILPTLITSPAATMRAAGQGGATACKAAAGGVLGVHFEGPFLSPRRPGVHPGAFIRAPEEADLAWLEGLAAERFGPVVVTMAPEAVGPEVLARLAGAGLILSAGHSEASFACMAAAGGHIRGVTHLFNAMPPPAAREPGLVGAALAGDAVCGVIVDGVHVHPAMLRLMLTAKPPGRIMLVSDAMPPVGTALDGFELMGRRIARQDGRLVAEDGTLAGADLCLAQAIRNAVKLLGVDLAEAVNMASAVPAAFLGIAGERGAIRVGLHADFTLLSAAAEVLGTWVGGGWQGEPGLLA